MNILNDLNIPPDPPESWQARISRLVKDVFLPYAVPYIIPAFLGWKLTRRLQVDPDERIKSLRAEIDRLQQQIDSLRGHMTLTQRQEYHKLMQINRDLDSITKMLIERQDIYCSPFKRKEGRKGIEKELKEFVVERSFEKELKLYRGVEEILEHDTHCGSSRNSNGCLMWVFMELWRTRARLNMQENVLLNMKTFDSKYK